MLCASLRDAILQLAEPYAARMTSPPFPVQNGALRQTEHRTKAGLGEAEPLPGLHDSVRKAVSADQREVAQELGDSTKVLRPRLSLVPYPIQDRPGVPAGELRNSPLGKSELHSTPPQVFAQCSGIGRVPP